MWKSNRSIGVIPSAANQLLKDSKLNHVDINRHPLTSKVIVNYYL